MEDDKQRLHAFVLGMAPESRQMARELNGSVMLDDQARIATLAEDLARRPGLWRTAMVSWKARESESSFDLDGIFTLQSEHEGNFAVQVFSVNRAQSHQILDVIVATLCNSLRPDWVARLLDLRHRRVFVSRFTSDFAFCAPVLSRFAFDHVERRFCAYLQAHPQLEPGQSIIKSFSEHTTFITNGSFLAALISDESSMTTEFFVLGDDSVDVLKPSRLAIEDFSAFSQTIMAQARDEFFTVQNE